MATDSEGNPYPGINAHLNSFLQSEGGGWESFHAKLIDLLTDDLEARLPANYYALNEKSLQVSADYLEREFPSGTRPKNIPDVMIYHTAQGQIAASSSASTPVLTFPVLDTLDEEELFTSTVIYRVEAGKYPGQPVTRLELLSPTNKPGGSHHPQYLTKRRETLRSGVRLVEIDFPHETRPVIHAVSSYPDGDENAFPYVILVSDPRPTLDTGKTDLYGFGVDDPLPAINVPLDGEDVILVNFNTLYNQAFTSRRVFSKLINYAQPPVNFERYTEADQQRILLRMKIIQESYNAQE